MPSYLSDENVDVIFPLAVALKCKIAIGISDSLISLERILDFRLER